MKLTTLKIIFLSILCFSITACGLFNSEPENLSSSEAAEKLTAICQDELSLPVTVQQEDNTLWLFVPLSEPILGFKATGKDMQKGADATQQKTLLYAKAEYRNGDFIVSYDVRDMPAYPKDMGYKTVYTDTFTRKQNSLLTAIMRAFGDAETKPEFIVLYFADTVQGIALKSLISFEDLKRVTSSPPSITQEEYARRYITEIFGDPRVSVNEQGQHLEFSKVTWPEFLARQIENRINFKFQSSDFPPSDNTAKEIREIVDRTLGYYDFKDFGEVVLMDLKESSEK